MPSAYLTNSELGTLTALRRGRAYVLPYNELAKTDCPDPDTPIPTSNGENGFVEYLRRQWDWSKRTFGPGFRTEGLIDHIQKELSEIKSKPYDLSEWADVIILALDGYWRHGGSPERLQEILQAKQDKNFARDWPDWRTKPENQAIEHDRSKDG